jgi:hypothetical protein
MRENRIQWQKFAKLDKHLMADAEKARKGQIARILEGGVPMKIRTDFVTNSSSSSYVLAKRLVIEDTNGRIRIPIEVSHTVEGENLVYVYWVNGSYCVDDELLSDALICNEDDDHPSEEVDNAKLAETVKRFWRDESALIKQFYPQAIWRIEEDNCELATTHFEKHCVFGEENAGESYWGDKKYWERAHHLLFREAKENRYEDSPRFSAFSVRDAKKFSYFNNYVRSANVYLYNTEYKGFADVDGDFIYTTAASLLAHSYENAAEIIETLRAHHLFPIVIGVLPKSDEFPSTPTDIWLLACNTTHDAVVDMYAIELERLETWLSGYTTPRLQGSLWEDIQRFIEEHAEGKEFYTIKSSRYGLPSTLYRQFWDGLDKSDTETEDEGLSLVPFLSDGDDFSMPTFDIDDDFEDDADFEDDEFIDKCPIETLSKEEEPITSEEIDAD